MMCSILPMKPNFCCVNKVVINSADVAYFIYKQLDTLLWYLRSYLTANVLSCVHLPQTVIAWLAIAAIYTWYVNKADQQ